MAGILAKRHWGSDARRLASWAKRAQPAAVAAVGGAATVASLAIVGHELHQQGVAPLLRLASAGPWFWAAFIAGVLIEPLIFCWLLRHLLGTGPETLPQLVRRQAWNTVLFGYAGDTLFLGWLSRRIGDTRRALALVCDMAIASALVNNAATLLLLFALKNQLQALAGARIDGWLIASAIGFAAVPLLLTAWRRRGAATGAAAITLAMTARTLVFSLLMALTWHFAVPELPLGSLLLLTAARMVVCRLPIIPNKDLAFAGCVALFLGPDQAIVGVVAAVALLTLVAEAVLLLLTWRRRD
jgi:hypothetical protein